jgi:hypothetical protein
MAVVKLTQTVVDREPLTTSGTKWLHCAELKGFSLAVGSTCKTFFASAESLGSRLDRRDGRWPLNRSSTEPGARCARPLRRNQMKRLVLATALSLTLTACLGETKWVGRVYDTLHGRAIELPARPDKSGCEAEWVKSDMFTSARYSWLGCEERRA